MSEQRQYCTFYLDEMLFGVSVEYVQEIMRCQEITRVALAPALIRGLINLRGQIVTAIDLRSLLGLAPREPDKSPMNIIVNSYKGNFSLLVDRIGDVLNLSEGQAEAPPNKLDGAAAELIVHAYKLEGELLLTLNVEQIVNHETLGGLGRAA